MLVVRRSLAVALGGPHALARHVAALPERPDWSSSPPFPVPAFARLGFPSYTCNY